MKRPFRRPSRSIAAAPVSRRLAALAGTLVLATNIASATLVRRMELPEVVSLAGVIVEGEVTAVRSFWEGNRIFTEIAVAVTRAHKGNPAREVRFRQLGGQVDSPVPLAMTVPGAPIHRVGDRGFYFLEERPGAAPSLIGVWIGHAPIKSDDRGEFVSFNGVRFTPGRFADRVREIVLDPAAAADPGTPSPRAGSAE